LHFFDADKSEVPPCACKLSVAMVIDMEGLMKPTDGKQQDINYTLGKRIRTARKSLGLSQTHIAKALGVSFQQVGKYESGANTMSVPTFLVMCRALNIKPSVLLDEYARL
jgi:ribosome-binding protein aMBF1 (putative translation factor)